MWGIIGLGNPGARYDGTRHNIGFDVVDLLEQRLGVRSRAGTHPFLSVEATLDEVSLVLVKPLTYVNRSGAAVRALMQLYPALDLQHLLVIIDDVALPFGRLRLRASGSAGGHNGLRSIEDTLQSRDYARLRLGVGAQQPGEDLADHVLGPFDADERQELSGFVARGADAVESVLRHGVARTLPQVNAQGGGSGRPPAAERPTDQPDAQGADPGARQDADPGPDTDSA